MAQMSLKFLLVAVLIAYANAQAHTVTDCADDTITQAGSGSFKYTYNTNIVAIGNLYTGLCEVDSFSIDLFAVDGSAANTITGGIFEYDAADSNPLALVQSAMVSGFANQTSSTVTFDFSGGLDLNPDSYYAVGIYYTSNFAAYYNSNDTTRDHFEYDVIGTDSTVTTAAGPFVISITQTATATGGSNSTGTTTGTVNQASTGTVNQATSTGANGSTGASTGATAAAGTTTGAAASTGGATAAGGSTSSARSGATTTTSKSSSTISKTSTTTLHSTSTTHVNGASSITVFSALSALFIAVLMM